VRPDLPQGIAEHPLEAVRVACARVAAAAENVRIDVGALVAYADALSPAGLERARAADPAWPDFAGDAETAAAWALALDCVNFGSGWFPELRKRPGHSGYRTLEACLRDRFARRGAPSARELAVVSASDCAALFEQAPPPSPAVEELLDLYARAWRELGLWLLERHGGSFLSPVRSARRSAERLVASLLELPLYRDVAAHGGAPVPFLKRAQLTAFDLARAVPGDEARFRDVARLTLFADNLVPHVLRTDGVLRYDPALAARIDRGELLVSGAPEEVEIRACAVHAVEQLCARLRARGLAVCPADLDLWLWLRGAEPRYKALPRHRARCPWY
jgi:hypothetical protein